MWVRGRTLLLSAFAALVAAPAGPVAAGEDEPPAPVVRPHERLAVAPSRPRPAAEYRRIEALVARLAELDRWQENGLTPSSGGGMGFEPGDPDADPATCTPTEAFEALAALGPEALPALLAHLDDEAGTRLSLRFNGGWGGMEFGTEVGVNPARPEELEAVRAAFPGGWRDDPESEDDDDFPFFEGPIRRQHRVTVGDVCYALIGQVANRVYEAVRYQPTSFQIVNSPTRDPRIARAVRAQWRGKDPRVELARRLMDDLHSTRSGIGHGWYGVRQAGAAKRLARYYPAEAEELLVRLLDGVEPEGDSPADEPLFDASVLVWDLAETDRPALRAALLRLAMRTREFQVLNGILAGAGRWAGDDLLHHVEDLLDEWPRRRHDHWALLHLFVELHRLWPERVLDLAARLPGTREVAQVRAELAWRHGVRFPESVWAPRLDDTGPAVPWTSSAKKPIERLRLCDVAALEIARGREELEFDEDAEEAVRDEQIARIREALAGEKPK